MLAIPPFKERKYGSHNFFFYIEVTTIIFQCQVAENWMPNDLKPLIFPLEMFVSWNVHTSFSNAKTDRNVK